MDLTSAIWSVIGSPSNEWQENCAYFAGCVLLFFCIICMFKVIKYFFHM